MDAHDQNRYDQLCEALLGAHNMITALLQSLPSPAPLHFERKRPGEEVTEEELLALNDVRTWVLDRLLIPDEPRELLKKAILELLRLHDANELIARAGASPWALDGLEIGLADTAALVKMACGKLGVSLDTSA